MSGLVAGSARSYRLAKITGMEQFKIYPGEHGWHVEERDGKFYCVETGLPVAVIVPPAEAPTSAMPQSD